ncbi:MAG: biotin-dependent carboxyltransferase family protein, partial [Candidatus Acidiferrum sp.]
MSSLVVQSPGLLTTVQDLGREGYGALGISPSGAADPVALRLGNLLVGNNAGAAALEMTLLGGSFVFPEGAVVAVTGADFGATIDGRAAEMWTAQTIVPGGVLAFASTRNFARGYLAVAGGIQVAPFLGSASTHLLSGLGGLEGRALRTGDVLPLGKPVAKIPRGKISMAALQSFRPRKVLRVTAGPQTDVFSDEALELFFRGTFRVSEASDRTGLRLEGHSIG